MLGVLVGLGKRAGTTWRPLNAAAHIVLGSVADDVWGYHGAVTPAGVAVVITMGVLAGLVMVILARSLRMSQLVVSAVVVATVGYLVHVHVAARTPGGLSDLLTVGEMRALYLTLAVALVAGTRFALSQARPAVQGR
jgi:hypothetical protein